MANEAKQIYTLLRKMDRTLTQIQRTLNRIAPPDVDAFDPDDETVDDLPWDGVEE